MLTPTRELALQIGEGARMYSKHVPIRLTVMHGGVGLDPQIARVQAGMDLLVATPRRLLDATDRIAHRHGGRVHLARDARCAPERLRWDYRRHAVSKATRAEATGSPPLL